MFKSILAALVCFSLSACSNVEAQAEASEVKTVDTGPMPTVFLQNIVRVECYNAQTFEGTVGTAFYIGNNRFISADHVVNTTKVCAERSTAKVLHIIETDEKNDFVLLELRDIELPEFGMPISCSGFKTERSYMSLGYALGAYFVMNKVTATSDYTTKDFEVAGKPRVGLRVLDGLIVRGMSGGPIINMDGEVVGINNITGIFGTKGYSYELKNTTLCNGKK